MAVAYLRLALNPDDTVALDQVLNVPRRGIGETARRRLEEYTNFHGIHPREAIYDMATSAESFEKDTEGRKTTERTKKGAQQLLDVLDELSTAAANPKEPASAVMESLLHGSCGMEEYCRTQPGDGENRWSNLNRLLEMAKQHQGSLSEFCDHMRLFQREDPGTENDGLDRLTLSTLHQTKGLEWAQRADHRRRAGLATPLHVEIAQRKGGRTPPLLRGLHPGHGSALHIPQQAQRRPAQSVPAGDEDAANRRSRGIIPEPCPN